MTKKAFDILLETDDFMVIDKAPGIPVHREPDQQGIASYVKAETGHANWFLCHRLDRETSGVLLMAKNKAAAALLSQQFATRTVTKFYLAVTDRKPKKSQGFISGDMEKARDGNWMLTHSHNRPAKTQFFSRSLRPGYRALLLRPLTGRTHQLRVAMGAMAAPILGDKRYRGKPADRLYLHAYALAFEFGGAHYQVQCPPTIGIEFEHFFTSDDDPWLAPQALPWPKK